MELFKREKYLNKIRPFYNDTDLIKVITGVRRCGKTSLMKTIELELLDLGVSKDNIIYIDLDSKEYLNIRKKEDLLNLLNSIDNTITSKTSDGVINKNIKYVFIDEIQNVNNFEEVVNAFRLTNKFSFFITGSNSYLLSGELITKLTGRYIEFEIGTLTFDEYVSMKRFYNLFIDTSLVKELDLYIRNGGFPRTVFYNDFNQILTYNKSLVKEIFDKDIKTRVRINNVSSFENIQTFIINNFGNVFSFNNVLKELKQDNINIKRETLSRYIKILKDSKIIQECKRFDLKSKKSLINYSKFYLTDLSFYMALNTDKRINYGPVLENVVYNYAKSKDYQISIGKLNKLECDFILNKNYHDYAYIQVCMSLTSSNETEEREYKVLEQIKDNYPKYILTRDDLIQHRSGIKHRNLPEFMCENEDFD